MQKMPENNSMINNVVHRLNFFAVGRLVGMSLSLVFSGPLLANITPPTSGEILQQLPRRMEVPTPSNGVVLPEVKTSAEKSGGVKVAITTVTFEGNSVFDDQQLLEQLGELDSEYDFAQLKALTDKVSAFYRQQGYPFSLAYLPAQDLANNRLIIGIVEGRYGQVTTSGDPALSAAASAFLTELKSGDMIQDQALERAVLILQDQPGISVTPIIKPSTEQATADLAVEVNRSQMLTGSISVNNYGNSYTGKNQGVVNLNINSPFMLGDQLELMALHSSQSMWLGSLNYKLPLGASGLRGQIGYAYTDYVLGEEFSALEATGLAKVTTLGLTYPLLRSEKRNVNLSSTYQHKGLHDKQGVTDSNDQKTVNSIAVGADFNFFDSFAGGGVSYGRLTWTSGKLDLDTPNNQQLDAVTANTQGSYNKINVALNRYQSLANNFSLHGQLQAQWANKNLDSSERFGLSGAYGVRAFPNGEGYGDRGWLTKVELKYATTVQQFAITPYIFAEAGRVQVNAKPWLVDEANYRSINGAGLGLQAQYKKFNVDASVAWRTQGEPTNSADTDEPVLWVNASYAL